VMYELPQSTHETLKSRLPLKQLYHSVNKWLGL